MKRFICLFVLLSSAICGPAQIITTVAGGATGHGGYWGDGGPATAAQIGIFGGLAVDNRGNIYIADANNFRVRKVDATTGIITTVAGTGTGGYNGDNIQATAAQIGTLAGLVVVDNFGNFYIDDGENNRIRKVDVSTGIITTFAGNGSSGFGGDGGPATNAPADFSCFGFDISGNVIIETSDYRIRKIDVGGIIHTIGGIGITGYSGDGGLATAAKMNPIGYSIAIDMHNNIYMCDSMMCVRKINQSTGIISRVAGTGDHIGYPYSGEGGPATDAHITPIAIAVDDTGNMYLVDGPNQRIEKVDTFGIIQTIAGTGLRGYSGDSGPATNAEVNYPENVTLDECGNVYIADFNNARVRKVTYHSSCTYSDSASLGETNVKYVQSFSVYPNPAHGTVQVICNTNISELTITNIPGQMLREKHCTTKHEQMDISGLPPGLYLLRITDEYGTVNVVKLMVE
jgi:Secretion system C-terminal sorting domain/NHL repeat